MPEQGTSRYVVVGVTPGQEDVVLLGAARFAKLIGAAIVCAHVDTTRYVVSERPDGTVTSMPFDPDLPELAESVFDPEHAEAIRGVLGGDAPELIFRELAGETARALTRIADVMNAELIVVGSRRAGLKSSLKEFFSGAVAAHLAHRQSRPVVVIPQAPVAEGAALPWEGLDPS